MECAVAVNYSMLDVKMPLARRIMCLPHSSRDSRAVFGIDLIKVRGQSHGFLGTPAIDVTLLWRPVDAFAEMIVIKDADVAGADGLSQALLALARGSFRPLAGHQVAERQAVDLEQLNLVRYQRLFLEIIVCGQPANAGIGIPKPHHHIPTAT